MSADRAARAVRGWKLPFALAWSEVRGHALRSAVTASAVFLGVASLLVMGSLSRGMEAQNKQQYLKMGGAQVIEISAAKSRNALQNARFALSRGLRLSDIPQLKTNLPEFDSWVPEVSISGRAIRRQGARVRAMGTASTWERLDVLGIELDTSLAELSEETWNGGVKGLAIVGSDVASKLATDGGSGLGQTLYILDRPARVVGIFKSQGTFDRRRMEVMVPLEWYRRVAGETDPELGTLRAHVGTLEAVAAAPQRLKDELFALHRGVEDTYVSTNDDLLENSRKTIRTMSLVTMLIAGVSLLSGAVGILNVQLASLSSRIRELGTSKALGAPSRLLFRQMLAESLLVAGLGGLAGTAVGILPTLIPKGFLPWSLTLSGGDLVLAVAMALGVGVVAGLLPAWKASGLDPVEAMRS